MATSDHEKQIQFTQHFAECRQAMQALAFSLVPNKADVDDILQETLKALWEKFDEYDPNRPFLPWANRFVYLKAQMQRRSQAIRHKYVFCDETFEELAHAQFESMTPEDDKLRSGALECCLTKLTDKQRELIECRYLSRRSLNDLAKERGKSPNALYKTLQRTRELLHHCIQGKLEQEGLKA